MDKKKQKSIKKSRGYCAWILGFISLILILTGIQHAMLVNIRYYNSPITGYPYEWTYDKKIAMENPQIKNAGYIFGPPQYIVDHPKANCTYQKWYGSDMKPGGYISARGSSLCSRPTGCYSYIEKCGDWSDFNDYFTRGYILSVVTMVLLGGFLILIGFPMAVAGGF